MTPHPTEPSMPDEAARDREEQLADVFQSYLDGMNTGQEMDFAQIRSDHPTLAEDLIDQLEVARQIRSEFGSSEPLGTLGDYSLRRQIGRGGMGVVYEAWQGSLDRRVALKVLPAGVAADDKAFHRFMREAKTAAKLRHRNVVGVYGMGVESDTPYYSMEYVEGETLAQIVARLKAAEARDSEDRTILQGMTAILGRKSSTSGAVVGSESGAVEPGGTREMEGTEVDLKYCVQLADAFADAAEGLQHAHAKGIIHRDIKPSNLILDRDGHLRILDFGLARLEGQESLTLSGDLMGTVLYMSPEQAMAKRIPLDHRTDIYSLGATLYEMLTRQPPFSGKTHHDTLSHIILRDPRAPRQLNPRVPKDLETIVLKCLRKPPEERYSTAEALAQDLRRFVRGDPVEAAPQSPWEKGARRIWQKRKLLVASAALLLVALAGLAVSNVLIAREREKASREREEALRERDARERELYVSDMRLAMEDWRSGNYPRFAELVDRQDAKPEVETDLRGWEWYYLDGLRDQELLALKGHSAGVTSLAWSPVKETPLLASGSTDGTVRIWDPSSESETRRLEYGSPVRAVAWSSDGEYLAVGGAEGGVRIWEYHSQKEPDVLGQDSTEIRAVAWSPDRQWLAAGERSGKVTVWDMRTGKRRAIRDGSDPRVSAVFALEFSPNSARLAAGVRGWKDASIFVWDTSTWDEPRQRAAVLAAIALSWSPDGRSLAMGTWDHEFTVWNTDTWEESSRLVGHSGSVSSLSWSPDGQWLASGAFEIKIWNTTSWEELHTLRGHWGYVSVSWSPDGRWLASGSKDGAVRLWDPFKEQEAVVLPGRTRVALSPDGRWLAACDLQEEGQADGFVQIFNAETREPVASGCVVPDGGHWSYSFSPDSRLLAWASAHGYGDPHFGVWDWREDREIFSIKVDRNVRCSAWSPDGRLVAIGGLGKATILDASSGAVVRTCAPFSDPARRVETKPNGGGSVWVALDRLSVIGVAWNHDGSRFAAASLGIWETASWTQVASSPPGDWRWVSWSPVDERLALAGNDGTIAVCDAGGRVLHETQGHPSLVRSIVWSPDGRRLASGAHDRAVKIWDASNLAELLTLRGHTGNILTLAWHRSGRWLVSGGPDCVRIWNAPGYEPEAER